MRRQILQICSKLRVLLVTGLLLSLCATNVSAQAWQQPERSQANLDALARVETQTYKFAEAGDIDMDYGVYVPTSYNESSPTPLGIALHGYGSGIMYMMEYNNLVELAENYGNIVATPMG